MRKANWTSLLICFALVFALEGVGIAQDNVFNSLDRHLTISDVDTSFTEALIEVRYSVTAAGVTSEPWETLGAGTLALTLGWGQARFDFREVGTLFYSQWQYSVDSGSTWCINEPILTFDLRDKCGTSQTD